MLLALLLAADAQADTVFAKPGWSRFAVPVAADHIAVMRVKRGWGPPGEDQATLTRSGHWLREDGIENGEKSTSISDMQSGVSYHLARFPDGRYSGLSIIGKARATPLSIEKTAQTDSLLGESCTVWQFKAKEYTEKNCLTADGIMLWQSLVSGRDGGELSSAKAVSITRRKVAREAAEIPAELLRLTSWGEWQPGAAGGPNDDVLLRGAADTPSESFRVRRLGKARMTEWTDGRQTTRVFIAPGMRLSLNERADGGLIRLDLNRDPQNDNPNLLLGKEIKVPGAPSKTILGERCTMFDMAPGVMDYGELECRTANGLILERVTTSRGRTTTLVAVRIDRGTLRPGDLAPPADILTRLK
ncbi:hypothetical protein HZY97_01230 [Sphingomonas sp. R-74633]|uniref:hypothetical protein n=1 Tax=Sphingomonas sp. R-74633 TaxID=2751188 RepID=UPI0015D353B8|nr:hypothetical protein [Sphingomonas sp. R-74633]NYT39366.1 hypothetical protein [Sphingomonas sp. R-74633]